MILLNADCVQAKELAALIAAGDENIISVNERVFFHAHIESCVGCAEFFSELQTDLQGILLDLKNLPEPELPEFFHEEVMGKIRGGRKEVVDRKKPGWFTRSYRNFGAVAATLTALVVVSVAVIGVLNGFDRVGTGYYNGRQNLGPVRRNSGFDVAQPYADIDDMVSEEISRFNGTVLSNAWNGEIVDEQPYLGMRNATAGEDAAFPVTVPPAGAGYATPQTASIPIVGEICYANEFAAGFDFIVTVYNLSAALDAVRDIGVVILEAETYCRASITLQVTTEEFNAIYAALALLGEIEYATVSELNEINILFILKDR